MSKSTEEMIQLLEGPYSMTTIECLDIAERMRTLQKFFDDATSKPVEPVMIHGINLDEVIHLLCQGTTFTKPFMLKLVGLVKELKALRQRNHNTDFERLVLEKRATQKERWGGPDEDFKKYQGATDLLLAANAYMTHSGAEKAPATWPWLPKFWKVGTKQEHLAKAAALIIAHAEMLEEQDKQITWVVVDTSSADPANELSLKFLDSSNCTTVYLDQAATFNYISANEMLKSNPAFRKYRFSELVNMTKRTVNVHEAMKLK